MKKHYLIFCLLAFGTVGTMAQINLWQSVEESVVSTRNAEERYTTPTVYGLYKLDLATLKAELANVPFESEVSARNSYAEFQFPLPDGSFRTYQVVEYEMMEVGLARKYNYIKTYIGVDKEYGSKIHFNFTKNQFFASIREQGITYYIDPYFKNNSEYYISYNIRNNQDENKLFECGVHELIEGEITEKEPEILDEIKSDPVLRGNRGEALALRTYRLAVSATFEFTDYHGGTVSSALDAIVVIVNRLNSVFEREVAIRLILIANNDQLIFTTADDDPFEDGNLGQMINQNQVTQDAIIGTTNYDMGHVFGRANLQGLAQLGAVCDNDRKARGGSVLNPPIGDPFTINIIAHEMGHQFSAPHTMYHCHNVNTPTGYEPGSGSTIMAYTGICSSVANIQNNSDDYYHANSLERIISFSRNGGGSSCAVDIDFGNTYPDPILNYPSRINIPVNTPFKLTGTAADAEDPSTLTYNWDQYQNGSRDFQSDPWDITQPIANEPLFRSMPPTSDPTRYFPALSRVVNGINYLFEQLPTYERDLKFRFIVRDNAAENGGTAWREVDIKVHDNSAAGKFEVTNYNVKDTIVAGDYVEITWNVAETDIAPINTKFVDIYLSDDGGSTFPYLIKSNTKNDGSTFVNIPDVPTIRFRVMVAASENIYFDVNNRSGVIVPQRDEAIGVSYDDQCYQICAPDLVEFDINTFGLGGYEGDVHFDFTGAVPAGGSVKFLNNDIATGSSTKLRMDLRDAVESGAFDLSFMVSGAGIDTIYRTIETVVVVNDFEALTLDAPQDGSTGNDFVPTLQWTPSPNATNYTVELSNKADFSTILFSRANILDTELTLDLQLEAGGVYFWRVKPRNACGLLDINKVSSFQVQSLSCEEYCSTEPDVIIPGSGTHVIEMNINTGVAITASDLNVTKINGRHQDMGQLVFTLEGPNGGKVILLNRQCGFTNTNFNMGFDDDAAISAPNCVNFDEGLRYVPEGNLSDYNGVNGSNYKLIVEDKVSGQSGLLESWCFEICGDISPEKPLLVAADSIHLTNFESRVISRDKLEVTHSQYSAAEITLTIVEAPIRGRLLLEGIPIATGATLGMQDILSGKLIYQNESMFYDKDHFAFVATDPGGGFLGTPRINFVIGLTATQTTLPAGSELLMYPNPANDLIHVTMLGDQLQIEEILVYNIQGSLLSTLTVNGAESARIQLQNYSTGIYLIQVRSGNYSIMRKFIKQ